MKQTHEKSYFSIVGKTDFRFGTNSDGRILQVGELAGEIIIEFLPASADEERKMLVALKEENEELTKRFLENSSLVARLGESNRELKEENKHMKNRKEEVEERCRRELETSRSELKTLREKLAAEKTARLNAEAERNAALQKERLREMEIRED